MGNGPFIRDYDYDAVFQGVHIQAVDFGSLRTLEFGRDGYSLHDGFVELKFRGETRRVLFDTNEARIAGQADL
jgi:hypothetical protein